MNEYTKLIIDSKSIYLNYGYISYKFNKDIYFKIAKLSYELFENEEFQYCFEPYYDVIDAFEDLDIPGIDLSLRQPVYYRSNITPTFVSERIVPKNRVNLFEELKEQNFNYHQPFLLLLDSKRTYGGDRLSLKSDSFYTKKLANVEESSDLYKIIPSTLKQLAARVPFKVGSIDVNENSRCILIKNYLFLFSTVSKYYYEKSKGNVGRKKQEVSLVVLKEIHNQYKHGIIPIDEAVRRSSLGSRSTFYRRVKEMEEGKKG